MKKNNSKKGFTLSETVIAITVITTVIVATSQMAISSIKMADSSLKRYSAMHIAEEGIEIVRVMRDSNWLQNKPWNEKLIDGTYEIYENSGYSFGAGELPWTLNPVSDPSEAGLITLGDNQKLRRIIKITNTPASNSINVESRVNYFVGSSEKELAVETELTNWKKGPI